MKNACNKCSAQLYDYSGSDSVQVFKQSKSQIHASEWNPFN